jgi:hypothetical protein
MHVLMSLKRGLFAKPNQKRIVWRKSGKKYGQITIEYLYLRKTRSKLVYEMTQQPKPEQKAKTEQSNIEDRNQFENFVSESLRIGSHLVGSKGSGKTRLLFCAAQELMKQENVRVIAFDGSEVWLYAFSQIPTFNISEKDIIATSRRQADTIEKYSLQNWNLVKLALETQKDILFRLKTRKPSKRGFFVRTVINYLDALQRQEKATTENHECTKAIGYFIEESQNCFNSRATSSTENEEFLSVFCEARNNREGFFTNSQRLNDFSKTIRAKQNLAIGKLSSEDLTPQLRKIEKENGLDFANVKPRNWFYDGSVFVSPEFKQNGKPYIVNQQIKQIWLNSLPKPKTLSEKINQWLKNYIAKANKPNSQGLETQEKDDSQEERELNDSDGLMTLDDDNILFPE